MPGILIHNITDKRLPYFYLLHNSFLKFNNLNYLDTPSTDSNTVRIDIVSQIRYSSDIIQYVALI